MAWRRLLTVLCALAVVAGLGTPAAWATRLWQAAPWSVTRVDPKDGSAPYCQAKAPFLLPVGDLSVFDLAIRADGHGPLRLHEQIAESSPAWMEFYGPKPTGMETFSGCRFWFDDGPMWPMDYTLNRETGAEEYNLGDAGRGLAALGSARFLKLENKPGAVTEKNGNRVFTSHDFGEFALRNTPELVKQLRTCLGTLGQATPFQPQTVYDPPGPAAASLPAMPARLEAARQACRQAPADDPDAGAMAWLRRGQAAADALRLGEARDAFAAMRDLMAKGVPLTPALRGGLERLVEVLVLSERLDEAFAVARTLPDNQALLATISLARGDYAGAAQQACAAASRVLGIPIKNWSDLAIRNIMDFRMETVEPQAATIRRLFLLWGLAALGQEKALISSGCTNCDQPMSAHVPACAVASYLGPWVGGDMLREDAPDTAVARRELGLAAFLRAESLRRAGYLLPVKADLLYAASELDVKGPAGAEGWAMRTEVALAALAADEGRPAEALANVRQTAAQTEALLGRQSLAWIEAAAVESEAASRLGDQPAAEVAARAGLAAAEGNLPPGHSLVLRLKRALCRALLDRGKTAEAGLVASQALGLPRIPRIDNKRLQPILRKLDAVQAPVEPPGAPPLNAADLKRFQEQYQRQRVEQIKLTRARHAILVAATGLPPIQGYMPVVARAERIRFYSVMRRLSHELPDPAEKWGAHFVQLGLSADEMRVHAYAEDSSVLGGLSYEDMLVNVARGVFPLDDGPVRPGGSPFVGVMGTAIPLMMEAMNWMSLANMFPGERRQSLVPGEAVEGLERFMGALHRLYLSPEEPEKEQRLSSAMDQAVAASRGEVLGNLLIRLVLVGDRAMEEESRHDSQQAIDGELWLRRQRGRLLGELALDKTQAPRLGHARALARRLALAMPYYTTAITNKFFTHVYDKRQQGIKGFESLTWFGSVKYAVKLDKLRQHLGPDEALVAWLPLEGCTHVFVIRKEASQWLILPQGQAALGARIRAIRASIEAFKEALGSPKAPAFPEEEAHALYQALFAPITSSLAGVSHLYTVQMGVVGGIPLGLLVTRPRSADREPDWLIDRYALTRVPGLLNPEILKRARPASPQAGHLLLAAGDPVVKEGTLVAEAGAPPKIRLITTLGQGFPPLPESREEMAAVADRLGLTAQEKADYVLVGPGATPQNVMAKLQGARFKYLLFATHGLVGKEDVDVGEPALLLSAGAGSRSLADDGLLRASDIVGLDLDTDLVLLSACETSPLGEDGAEPLAGLASAFLVAGARAVLSTQWTVLSDAAKSVSVDLMAGLGQGDRQPARVLQQAIAHLRTQPTPEHLERHPAYWAPFELVAFPQ